MHVSTLHPRTDTRIFVKQIQTLSSAFNHQIMLIVADGEGDSKQADNNFCVKDLGRIHGNRIIRILKGLFKAFLLIRKVKPLIIHFHDPEIIPLGIILRFLGYKVVYDVHEDFGLVAYSREWIPWPIRYPLKLAIRFSERVGATFFNANIAATKSISRNFPQSNTITVQNFPLPQELILEQKIDFENRAMSVSYIGYATSNRGSKEMVQAIEELEDLDDFSFEFAGVIDPPTLRNELMILSGWRFVNYHGHVSRSTMARILGNTRAGLVLFHPSANHINAQPNKIFEYMAAGLPVIGSDFPLWREIIDGAKCGLLVDPLSSSSIADAIRWIFSNPYEAEAMGVRGREAVEKTYNWKSEGLKLVELYNKLLIN
ncbi:MAG: group 1 glycosyl transferase [Opitutae bacterium]|nr:group 1 glycosyl transferase [Opitutae bacterium]